MQMLRRERWDVEKTAFPALSHVNKILQDICRIVISRDVLDVAAILDTHKTLGTSLSPQSFSFHSNAQSVESVEKEDYIILWKENLWDP